MLNFEHKVRKETRQFLNNSPVSRNTEEGQSTAYA